MQMLPSVTVLTVFALCLVHTAAGYVDFLGLSHAPTRVERPDGMVEWSHDVHHVFPETGTFFKAKYHAVHHRRWHFVELHKHVDFMSAVDCGASDEELHVKGAPASLIAELAKQDYQHTVIVAHSRYHCGEVGIFRRVNNASHDAAGDVLHLDTTQLLYEHVFETLHLVMDTNHLPHTVEHAPTRDADELHQIAMAEREAEIAELSRLYPEYRAMRRQDWWSDLVNAVKKVVSKVTKIVKKAVKIVVAVVNTVKALVTGNYEYNKDWSLVKIAYNNDVTKTFDRWDVVGAAKVACSVNAAVGVHFSIDIDSYKLQLAEAYFYGSFAAGVRGQFSSSINKALEGSMEVANIKLSAITFALGVIPVVISPSIPITVGYSVDIDGAMNLNVLLAASGSIKQGLRFTRSNGLAVVNEKSFNFVKDFTPREFKYEIGISAWVMAQLYLQINFLGGPYAGVKVAGEALLENNQACNLLMTFNLQPIIVAGAKIDISIGSLQIYNKNWGPAAVWSTKIPLFRLCLPTKSSKSKSHYYLAQAETTNDTEPVVTTVATSLSGNFTGTVWYGTSNCANDESQEQAFSIQFTTGDAENSTVLVITISRNVSTGNGTYEQTNVQRSFEFFEEITAGMLAQLTLLNGTEQVAEEDVTAASGNATNTTDPFVNTTMWFAVNVTDTRIISIDTPMVCGNVSMWAKTMTNDNSSFTIFASGGGEPETLFDQVKPYLVYAPVLGAVVLVAILAGVLISRRRAQRRAAAPKFVAPILNTDQYRDNAGTDLEQRMSML